MELTVNGEKMRFASGRSVSDLVAALGLEPRKLAVERNRMIVPKSTYAETVLADGDQLEIVHFVGGG